MMKEKKQLINVCPRRIQNLFKNIHFSLFHPSHCHTKQPPETPRIMC